MDENRGLLENLSPCYILSQVAIFLSGICERAANKSYLTERDVYCIEIKSNNKRKLVLLEDKHGF
jgi:hypothetical protein